MGIRAGRSHGPGQNGNGAKLARHRRMSAIEARLFLTEKELSKLLHVSRNHLGNILKRAFGAVPQQPTGSGRPGFELEAVRALVKAAPPPFRGRR